MVYLWVDKATYIKTMEGCPIYEYHGKFYVGVENLCTFDEAIENCIECDTLEAAESAIENMSYSLSESKGIN